MQFVTSLMVVYAMLHEEILVGVCKEIVEELREDLV